MSHPMRNPLTVEAAYGVQAKPGYLNMGMTDSGMPANQHTLVEFLSSKWELIFFEFAGVDGYVVPTTDDLQRLYDATTNSVGDPTHINGYLFRSMVYDLVLETPNDPRWDPFYNLMAELAKMNHPEDIAILKMFQDAKAGKEVDNVWFENEIGYGTITQEELKDLPYGGDLPPPAGSSPGTGGGGLDSDLPDVDLDLYGLSDHNVNLLISLYMGAFHRAPEHEGLDFWARKLSEKLASGKDHAASQLDVANEIYKIGTANGEKGTDQSTVEFITSAYNIILGREPEAEGMAYWTLKLDQDGLTRADFLVPYFNAALQSPFDSEHLLRKISVAKVTAQEHVSGQTIIDGGLLESVARIDSDEAAWAILDEVYETYGYGFTARTLGVSGDEEALVLASFGAHDAQDSFDAYIENFSDDAFSADVQLTGLEDSSSGLSEFSFG